MAYMRLGDLLVSSGVITNEQLEKALEMQKETKERLGDVLIRAGFITEQQLIEALEMQLGVEFVDLTAVSIPVELASYVPKNIAKKFCVVPVKLVKDTLYLAMSDPLDFVAQEEVKVASRKRVIPMIATRRTTEHAISLLYGSEGTAGVIEEYPELHISASIGGDYGEAKARFQNDERIVRFLNMFPGDDSMQNLTNAMNTGDTTTAFRAVHTLKGVALNLGLGSLAHASSQMTEAQRAVRIRCLKAYSHSMWRCRRSTLPCAARSSSSKSN